MRSVLVAALAALLLSGCVTGPSEAEVAAKEWAGCKTDVGPFYRSLLEVDARLSAGLAYADYQKRVGDVFSAHNRMPRVGGSCYDDIYLPLFKVFQHYSKASVQWGKCLDDEGLSCDQEKAGQKEIDAATGGLEKVKNRWEVAEEDGKLPTSK